MTFKPGDDVIVEFDGWEHRGEIKTQHNGWVTARIQIDPDVDYPESPRMGATSIVCVPERNVRHAA